MLYIINAALTHLSERDYAQSRGKVRLDDRGEKRSIVEDRNVENSTVHEERQVEVYSTRTIHS